VPCRKNKNGKISIYFGISFENWRRFKFTHRMMHTFSGKKQLAWRRWFTTARVQLARG
jgi:hypothetical protein